MKVNSCASLLLLPLMLTAGLPSQQLNWIRRQSAQSPPPTLHASMAYDSTRGVMVLWTNGETWEWNGSGWTHRVPAMSPSTSPLTASLAYDSLRGVTVLVMAECRPMRGAGPERGVHADGVIRVAAPASEPAIAGKVAGIPF